MGASYSAVAPSETAIEKQIRVAARVEARIYEHLVAEQMRAGVYFPLPSAPPLSPILISRAAQ